MNAPHLPRRFLLRLALPLAGVAALLAAAEPLPEPAPAPLAAISAETDLALERMERESAQLHRQSAHAAERARAGASAAALRWLITLPAASGRRCLVDTCSE